jgi:hypothetical protein
MSVDNGKKAVVLIFIKFVLMKLTESSKVE